MKFFVFRPVALVPFQSADNLCALGSAAALKE
jgi:hypothetical protein